MLTLSLIIEFDEGHLSRDPEAAQEEINRTLAIMEDIEPPVRREDNAIRYVFQTTWDRLKQVTKKPTFFQSQYEYRSLLGTNSGLGKVCLVPDTKFEPVGLSDFVSESIC